MDIIIQFSTQFPTTGLVIHVSMSNNFTKTLNQSGFDIISSSLHVFCIENRLKVLSITTLLELLALYQYLASIPSHLDKDGPLILIVVENMNTILFSNKDSISAVNVYGNSSEDEVTSQISMETLITAMKSCKHCLTAWISPSLNAIKSSITVKETKGTWKNNFNKAIPFSY